MVQRLSYRRQNSYATRSNRVKVVKTPGGKLAYIYTNKTTKPVKCGDCGCALNGVKNRILEFWALLLILMIIFIIQIYISVSFLLLLLCFRSLLFVLPNSTEWARIPRLSIVLTVVPTVLDVSASASSVLSSLKNKESSRRSSSQRPALLLLPNNY